MSPRSYFIPFSNLEKLSETSIRNERYSSDMVECLSGEWDFKYYKSCLDIPNELDSDEASFDKVNVPSMWQFTGYEKPYYLNTRYQFKPNPPEIPYDCPAGVYRKIIEISDNSLNYYLTFLGVAGAFDLFVNGKLVGYSEGSHNTSQFELNDYITKGKKFLLLTINGLTEHILKHRICLDAMEFFVMFCYIKLAIILFMILRFQALALLLVRMQTIA